MVCKGEFAFSLSAQEMRCLNNSSYFLFFFWTETFLYIITLVCILYQKSTIWTCCIYTTLYTFKIHIWFSLMAKYFLNQKNYSTEMERLLIPDYCWTNNKAQTIISMIHKQSKRTSALVRGAACEMRPHYWKRQPSCHSQEEWIFFDIFCHICRILFRENNTLMLF